MKNFSLAQKAQQHYKDVMQRFPQEIASSISFTKRYDPNSYWFIEPRELLIDSRSIKLVPRDSVSCLFEEPIVGRTAILNFASYKTPGGGFLSGMTTQEESLCHASTLYPVLLAFDNHNYYEWNRHNLNKGLYTNRALYSFGIVFERQDKRRYADVLTCAAPNCSVARYRCGVSLTDNDAALQDRITFMLNVAEENHVDTLILGAWGCGVFGQNPYTVAEMLYNTICQNPYKFSIVYFAVPGGSEDGNYVAFEEVLSRK